MIATEGRKVLQRIQVDPVFFLREILGCEPWTKQVAIAEALRDHRRIAVVGANSTGKDFAIARLALWWMCAFVPAKCIITGPTYRQIASIVWKEIRMAFFGSRYPLGGRMLDTPRWDIADDSFCLGFSTDQPYALQGFHSPNLLAIISEAHGVDQDDIEAIKRLNPSRLLLSGNPLTLGGELYEAFHGGGELYHCISISALETPNILQGKTVIPGMVTPEDVEERKREWGEAHPLYVSGVLGQWPNTLEDCLIQRAWVDRALTLGPGGMAQPQTPIVACDVARFGGDKTTVVRRDFGLDDVDTCDILWAVRGRDTMEIAGFLAGYKADHPEASLVVDDTGVGGGVTDRLREQGIPVVAFIAGGKSSSDRYANAQAEVWGRMAEALREGKLRLPNNPALIAQLVSRRYKIQSDRRIILESKEQLKAQGGKSPDEADALAMTFAPAAGGLQIWL